MAGLWAEEALEVVEVLPDRLKLTDALPRTQVGKISKVTLRADIRAKLEHETTASGSAIMA